MNLWQISGFAARSCRPFSCDFATYASFLVPFLYLVLTSFSLLLSVFHPLLVIIVFVQRRRRRRRRRRGRPTVLRSFASLIWPWLKLAWTNLKHDYRPMFPSLKAISLQPVSTRFMIYETFLIYTGVSIFLFVRLLTSIWLHHFFYPW